MSYCRFSNTLGDLRDCYEAMAEMDHTPLSPEEHKAMVKLVKLCERIVDDYVDMLPETAP
jgi:hypothetical protein